MLALIRLHRSMCCRRGEILGTRLDGDKLANGAADDPHRHGDEGDKLDTAAQSGGERLGNGAFGDGDAVDNSEIGRDEKEKDLRVKESQSFETCLSIDEDADAFGALNDEGLGPEQLNCENVKFALSVKAAGAKGKVYLDPTGQHRFAAIELADTWKSFKNSFAYDVDCFWLGTIGFSDFDEFFGLFNSMKTKASIVLKIPSWKLFLENSSLETQITTAWKMSRNIRSAGRVKAILFDDKHTLIFLSEAIGEQTKETNLVPQKPNIEKRSRGKRTGWGGSNRLKTQQRFKIFRDWLIETFGGVDALRAGTGVLDVAGGKGELAFRLLNFSGIPTTIVDPRPMNVPDMLKHLTRSHIQRIYFKHECAPIIEIPFPGHIRCCLWFPMNQFTESDSPTISTFSCSSASQEEKLRSLEHHLRSSSIICGMHADQATEAIVDWGITLGKPFATVPCCVFPNIFKERSSVRTYDQFCSFLRDKYPDRVHLETLDFSGRNLVVYGHSFPSMEQKSDSSEGIVVPSWSPLASHLNDTGENFGDIFKKEEKPLIERKNHDQLQRTDSKSETLNSEEEARFVSLNSHSDLTTEIIAENIDAPVDRTTAMLWGWSMALVGVVFLDGEWLVLTAVLFLICMFCGIRKHAREEPERRLKKTICRLEKNLQKCIHLLKTCELRKRGYRVGMSMTPPILRIEWNDYLRYREDIGDQASEWVMECQTIRQTLYNLMSRASKVYRTVLNQLEHHEANDTEDLLLCRLVTKFQELKVYSAKFRVELRSKPTSFMLQQTSYIETIDREVFDLVQESYGEEHEKKIGVTENSFRVNPTVHGSAMRIADVLHGALRTSQGLSASLVIAREKVSTGSSSSLDLDSILRALLDDVHCSHASIIADIEKMQKDRKPRRIELETTNETPSIDDGAFPKKASTYESNPTQDIQTHTEIFQGIVDIDDQRKDDRLRAEEALLEDHTYVAHSILQELDEVLEYKRKLLAPEKVMSGSNIDDLELLKRSFPKFTEKAQNTTFTTLLNPGNLLRDLEQAVSSKMNTTAEIMYQN